MPAMPVCRTKNTCHRLSKSAGIAAPKLSSPLCPSSIKVDLFDPSFSLSKTPKHPEAQKG